VRRSFRKDRLRLAAVAAEERLAVAAQREDNVAVELHRVRAPLRPCRLALCRGHRVGVAVELRRQVVGQVHPLRVGVVLRPRAAVVVALRRHRRPTFRPIAEW